MKKMGEIILLCLVLSGCAGMSVKPITDEQDACTGEHSFWGCATGIRYYESAPYLLVYSDGKGGLTTSIEHLPDLSRKYNAEPYNFLASNETELTFNNGMITMSSNVGDSAILPKAVIEGVKAVAQSLASARAFSKVDATGDFEIPPPQLWRIYLNDGVTAKDKTVSFIKAQGTDPDEKPMRIKVTLTGEEVQEVKK